MPKNIAPISENEYRQLRSAFEQFSPLSEELWQELSKGWKVFEFDRQDFICQEGQTERYFYFVCSGVQRIYILSQKGQEQIIGFSFEGDFSGVYDSFSYQIPSQLYLQTLTKSRLIGLTYQQMEALYDRFPDLDRWGRLFHLAILIGRVKREVEVLTSTAAERYHNFLARKPNGLLQVPQKYLANYLGMSAETFSRLRKQTNS